MLLTCVELDKAISILIVILQSKDIEAEFHFYVKNSWPKELIRRLLQALLLWWITATRPFEKFLMFVLNGIDIVT